MKDKSDFKKLIKLYNKRDEKTKEEYKEFLKGGGVELLTEYLERIPSIEQKLNVMFPSSFLDFLMTKSSWYIVGKSNDFCLYTEEDIYEFNYIGDYKGKSSLDEMHDFLLIGQDQCESSYFVDPYNKLGYGTEAVWKVNRCAIDRRYFELLATDFYTFIKKCIELTDNVTEEPFKDYKEPKDYNEVELKDIFEQKYSSDEDYMKAINQKKEELKKIFKIMKEKNIVSKISYRNPIIKMDPCVYKESLVDDIPFDLFKIIFDDKYLVYTDDINMHTVYGEELSCVNYGDQSLSLLKDMFVFIVNEHSIFKKNSFTRDYFFVDPHNKLGRGPEAVYIICTDAKSIEEACYVAENIVEFFRLFADEKPINTTPIGKLNILRP